MQWKIVEFLKDKSIAGVPKPWIKKFKNYWVCYWPDHNVESLRKRSIQPTIKQDSKHFFKCRVLLNGKEFISFQEALAAELKLASPDSSKADKKSRYLRNCENIEAKSQLKAEFLSVKPMFVDQQSNAVPLTVIENGMSTLQSVHAAHSMDVESTQPSSLDIPVADGTRCHSEQSPIRSDRPIISMSPLTVFENGMSTLQSVHAAQSMDVESTQPSSLDIPVADGTRCHSEQSPIRSDRPIISMSPLTVFENGMSTLQSVHAAQSMDVESTQPSSLDIPVADGTRCHSEQSPIRSDRPTISMAPLTVIGSTQPSSLDIPVADGTRCHSEQSPIRSDRPIISMSPLTVIENGMSTLQSVHAAQSMDVESTQPSSLDIPVADGTRCHSEQSPIRSDRPTISMAPLTVIGSTQPSSLDIPVADGTRCHSEQSPIRSDRPIISMSPLTVIENGMSTLQSVHAAQSMDVESTQPSAFEILFTAGTRCHTKQSLMRSDRPIISMSPLTVIENGMSTLQSVHAAQSMDVESTQPSSLDIPVADGTRCHSEQSPIRSDRPTISMAPLTVIGSTQPSSLDIPVADGTRCHSEQSPIRSDRPIISMSPLTVIENGMSTLQSVHAAQSMDVESTQPSAFEILFTAGTRCHTKQSLMRSDRPTITMSPLMLNHMFAEQQLVAEPMSVEQQSNAIPLTVIQKGMSTLQSVHAAQSMVVESTQSPQIKPNQTIPDQAISNHLSIERQLNVEPMTITEKGMSTLQPMKNDSASSSISEKKTGIETSLSSTSNKFWKKNVLENYRLETTKPFNVYETSDSSVIIEIPATDYVTCTSSTQSTKIDIELGNNCAQPPIQTAFETSFLELLNTESTYDPESSFAEWMCIQQSLNTEHLPLTENQLNVKPESVISGSLGSSNSNPLISETIADTDECLQFPVVEMGLLQNNTNFGKNAECDNIRVLTEIDFNRCKQPSTTLHDSSADCDDDEMDTVNNIVQSISEHQYDDSAAGITYVLEPKNDGSVEIELSYESEDASKASQTMNLDIQNNGDHSHDGYDSGDSYETEAHRTLKPDNEQQQKLTATECQVRPLGSNNYQDSLGYLYTKNNLRKSNLYLRCKNSVKHHCPARITVRDNNYEESVMTIAHNHPPEKKVLDRQIFDKKLEENIDRDPFQTPRQVYLATKQELLNKIDTTFIPSLKKIEGFIYRRQRKYVPKLPSTIEEFEKSVDDERYRDFFTKDQRDLPFYRGCWTSQKGERNLAFISETTLKLVNTLNHASLFMDGTYKALPHHISFRQLYVISVTYENQCYPLAYIFMEKKTFSSYDTIFHNLKFLMPSVEIAKIMTDYEAATRKALKKHYPNARIAGCFFHYVQAIVKCTKRFGLRKDERFTESIKRVCHLALLPNDFVVKGFESIDASLSTIASKRWERFRKYWLKQWAPANISVYGLDDRTNNFSESNNKSLNLFLLKHHPNIWNLIKNLKLLEMDKGDKITKALLGEIFELKKCKDSIAFDKKLRLATDLFEQDEDVSRFLDRVSYGYNVELFVKDQVNIMDDNDADIDDEIDDEVIPNNYCRESDFRKAHPRVAVSSSKL